MIFSNVINVFFWARFPHLDDKKKRASATSTRGFVFFKLNDPKSPHYEGIVL